jgi:subtilisin
MLTMGGTAHGARRRKRSYCFLGLLLLVLVAPIGWVAASEPRQPYVIVFNDAAVTVADAAPALTSSSLSYLLSTSAQRSAANVAVGSAEDGVATRRVDPERVARQVHDVAARNGVTDINDVYSAAVGGFSARLSTAQSAAIANDPSVAAVIPDEQITADDITGTDGAAGLGGTIRTTSDPTERIQPGIRRIGARAPSVELLTTAGMSVDADVAILDTGIQRDHPDLNVVGGYNCTSGNRDKWDDNEGHGTHVAGIVGALDNRIGVTGVAPGVRLWSVKVLDQNGRGYISWLVCGVDWVTAQRDKANPTRPLIEVANMSLAFTLPGANDSSCGTKASDDMLHVAICRSVGRGIVYVVAAGNESHNVRTVRPAAYDEVITVSALADYDGRGGAHGYPAESCPYWSPEPDDAFTSFSNYGADVDLIAPGKCILSTYLHGRYAWMSGTSMATPHVTGAAVLYRAMFPRATPAQVRLGLEASGTYDWRTSTDPDPFHEKAVWVGQFKSPPDFSIGTSLSSGVVGPGAKLPIDVAVTRVGGFDDSVEVSLVNPPTGISASTIATKDADTTLTVRVAPDVPLGRYTVTVIGTSLELVRSQTISIVVRGEAPQSAFTAPRGALTIQSASTVDVAWTERSGGAEITDSRLDRQSGAIRTPGTCDGVTWSTEQTRHDASAVTETVRTGYCYRWVLTLSDAAGYSSTTYSGAVLVDASAGRAPVAQARQAP